MLTTSCSSISSSSSSTITSSSISVYPCLQLLAHPFPHHRHRQLHLLRRFLADHLTVRLNRILLYYQSFRQIFCFVLALSHHLTHFHLHPHLHSPRHYLDYRLHPFLHHRNHFLHH